VDRRGRDEFVLHRSSADLDEPHKRMGSGQDGMVQKSRIVSPDAGCYFLD
jgi:hypothetical protein